MSNKSRFRIKVHKLKIDGSTQIMALSGREAWAMSELAKAGDDGCTPITRPAPRWSAYVHLLRKRGLAIQTVTEPHGGTFAGHHARYVLRDKVEIEGDDGQSEG
jgi:hypothetical protein